MEISEEDYKKRLAIVQGKREEGVPFIPADINEQSSATEVDYIEALESLGVDFGG